MPLKCIKFKTKPHNSALGKWKTMYLFHFTISCRCTRRSFGKPVSYRKFVLGKMSKQCNSNGMSSVFFFFFTVSNLH